VAHSFASICDRQTLQHASEPPPAPRGRPTSIWARKSASAALQATGSSMLMAWPLTPNEFHIIAFTKGKRGSSCLGLARTFDV
jgi:hypothetical protein